ncbi:GNAT family N-acetyltransferase [Ktedonobacter robiniae]|uniref:N-acetyltransferase n=1 Tax=Ktedonobacter robiniae TaxID=2778365 RepID=A0ABQ3UNE1_9CHLR|nr:GNAT family N-acetyltransferase [Ktedonobacter robiniae]GHO54224.1 N-acetyltransferase [Ktedonobacter robiniae]
MQKRAFYIRALAPEDRAWLIQFLHEHWGDSIMISRGITHDLTTYPGFIAIRDGERIGLLTYHIQEHNCEVTSLDSLLPGLGIGTALLEAARGEAVRQHCSRFWLITTNDNIDALRFYQKRGFTLVAVHRDAISGSRKIKPGIPLLGAHGIPIRDEIELEFLLA